MNRLLRIRILLRFGLSRPQRNTPLGECSYDLEEILSALAAFIKVVGARYGCHHDFRLDELKPYPKYLHSS